jgi:hypothetical protein
MISTGGTYALNYVWDTGTLSWIPQTSTGGGGGGAVTIADGADVAEGATTDAKVTGDTAGTVSAKLRGLTYLLGPASSETLSNVAASASSVTLLSAGTRRGATFFNDSTSAAYIKLGATASTTSFTYKVFAYQTVELPQPTYQGQVDAIWDSATGSMRVTVAA